MHPDRPAQPVPPVQAAPGHGEPPEAEPTLTSLVIVTKELRGRWLRAIRPCIVRDSLEQVLVGAVLTVAVILVDRSLGSLVVRPLVLGLLLVHLIQTNLRGARRRFRVGQVVELEVGRRLLRWADVCLTYGQITGLRPERGMLRVDHGPDHTHLPREVLSDEVVAGLRRRMATRHALPPPRPGTTDVPMTSRMRWRLVLLVVAPGVVLNLLTALVGLKLIFSFWPGLSLTTVDLVWAGGLVAGTLVPGVVDTWQRLDRPGEVLRCSWQGRVLVVESATSHDVLRFDDGSVTDARIGRFGLVRVHLGRRRLALPVEVVPEALLAEIRGGTALTPAGAASA